MTAPLLTPPGLATPGPVGLVGLGLVGNALARRLAAHGFSVWGHDTITEARKAFKAKGFETADSIAQLAQRSTCMLLAVFDSQGVLDVVEGPNGLPLTCWRRWLRACNCAGLISSKRHCPAPATK
jgi:hypothetical protein